jgi:glycosyltransferase involved in cell wall biosynthesis
MRIAFFTPVSPIQSALADFGEGLAVGLARQPAVTVDLFLEGTYQPTNASLVQNFRAFSWRDFERRAKDYDACLYSLGDHGDYHGYMLDFVRRYPGVVILNDLTLHRCILLNAFRKNAIKSYLQDLDYAYGVNDLRFAEQIQAGLGNQLILEYPLFERIVDDSRGVIVQNQYARNKILAKRPHAKVQCIPYPFFMPPGFPDLPVGDARQEQRAKMGLEDKLVIGSFGIFVPDKHLEDCLNAFAQVARRYPQLHYLLGGDGHAGYDLRGRIRELGLESQITITGWLPPIDFVHCMLALDIGIHLRSPHIGGTPYTPIRLLGLGINTIVSDIEPLAEIPQGAIIKIAPDEYQGGTLTTLLEYLVSHPEFRQLLGDNGRQFVERDHHIDRLAQMYTEFLQAV